MHRTEVLAGIVLTLILTGLVSGTDYSGIPDVPSEIDITHGSSRSVSTVETPFHRYVENQQHMQQPPRVTPVQPGTSAQSMCSRVAGVFDCSKLSRGLPTKDEVDLPSVVAFPNEKLREFERLYGPGSSSSDHSSGTISSKSDVVLNALSPGDQQIAESMDDDAPGPVNDSRISRPSEIREPPLPYDENRASPMLPEKPSGFTTPYDERVAEDKVLPYDEKASFSAEAPLPVEPAMKENSPDQREQLPSSLLRTTFSKESPSTQSHSTKSVHFPNLDRHYAQMVSDSPVLVEVLQARGEQALEAYDLVSAEWYFERWRAEAGSAAEAPRRALAECFLRRAQPQAAFRLLHDAQEPESRYLLALAAFRLEKYREAESALLEGSHGPDVVCNGAYGYSLLGDVCRRTNRAGKAVDYYRKSLELDPLLWSAHRALCELGFGPVLEQDGFQHQTPMSVQPDPPRLPVPSSSRSGKGPVGTLSFGTPSSSLPENIANNVPSPMDLSPRTTLFQNTPAKNLPPGERRSRRSIRVRDEASVSKPTLSLDTPRLESGRARRSARLEKQRKEKEHEGPTGAVKATKLQSRKKSENTQQTGDAEFALLFRIIGEAYRLMCEYHCTEAIELLSRLSVAQYQSGWVYSMLGRCYFEQADYSTACEYFQSSLQLDPFRIAGLELYSTALWHLRRDVELSYLAHYAVEFDRLVPETWIVVGNCFSLQKEHETALRFFQRALQLDPHIAYAHTLCAHEYVANEDYDKASSAYRNAIRLDERHYNAWYGLGNIYYRQEKFQMAAYHFRKAISIHGRSSVLFCYLGMVFQACQMYREALQALNKSCKLKPSNMLSRFQRANVYFSMEDYENALKELKAVADVAPREASIHFLLGKVYRKLGDIDLALVHFSTSLDLNPKDKAVIKTAIEKLNTVAHNADSQSEDEF